MKNQKITTEKMFIGGNWKLNPETRKEARSLARGIEVPTGVETALFPPLVFLEELADTFPKLTWGAQDFYHEDAGAYTGEVSLPMLKSVGVNWVLVGHSDRRGKFGETDKDVNKKLRAALNEGFNVVLAVGEIKKQSNSKQVVTSLRASTEGVSKQQHARLTVAYEPVWAISATAGSEPATPDHAESVITELKKELSVRYLYGGSVDSENAESFLSRPGISGALVGSASLDGEEFSTILNIAANLT